MAKDQAQGSGTGRAADNLYRTFATMIESGELKVGDALPPEREIVETYGVSRTVVREAVQSLASRGLVEARPRHRPVVRRPSYETAMDTVGTVVSRLLMAPGGVQNLFETRVLIEAALVRAAATSASAAQISQLARTLTANKSAISDSERFYETDLEFHRVFYEISGNPVLVSVHKAFVEWLSPHWLQMPHLEERNAVNYASHAAIFDAIQTGDSDAAEAALRKHLGQAWDQVRDTFA